MLVESSGPALPQKRKDVCRAWDWESELSSLSEHFSCHGWEINIFSCSFAFSFFLLHFIDHCWFWLFHTRYQGQPSSMLSLLTQTRTSGEVHELSKEGAPFGKPGTAALFVLCFAVNPGSFCQRTTGWNASICDSCGFCKLLRRSCCKAFVIRDNIPWPFVLALGDLLLIQPCLSIHGQKSSCRWEFPFMFRREAFEQGSGQWKMSERSCKAHNKLCSSHFGQTECFFLVFDTKNS